MGADKLHLHRGRESVLFLVVIEKFLEPVEGGIELLLQLWVVAIVALGSNLALQVLNVLQCLVQPDGAALGHREIAEIRIEEGMLLNQVTLRRREMKRQLGAGGNHFACFSRQCGKLPVEA